MRRKWIVPIVAIAFIVGVGSAALALVVDTGGAMVRRVVRTEVTATVSNSTAFVTVPGGTITINVGTGTTRLILARFTAESQCIGGTTGNWCSMRIIAVNTTTGGVIELNPASGIDFAFDSVSADTLWEGHSMARSLRLGAGTWAIQAQRAVTNTSTNFRLDDWTFEVDMNN